MREENIQLRQQILEEWSDFIQNKKLKQKLLKMSNEKAKQLLDVSN